MAGLHRNLSRRQYGLVVGGGAVLTALQLLVLPRTLGSRGFGIAVVGISATQAVFALADLGFARLADDSTRSAEQRNRLRSAAMITTSVTVACSLAVVAVLRGLAIGRSIPEVCAASIVTAYVLVPLKLAAGVAEAGGDEVGSAAYHFVWQNLPKVGLVVGALWSRTPLGAAVGGLVAALVLGRPRLGVLDTAEGLRAIAKDLTPAWLSSLSAFLIAWGGTYSIGAAQGLAAAGRFDFDYRVLNSASYLYLPFGSVLTARINMRRREAPRQVTVRATALVAGTLVMAIAGILAGQRRVVGFAPLPAIALVILAILVLLTTVSFLMGVALVAFGRLWATVTAVVVAGAIALVGHATITPVTGPIGAASVSAFAMAVAAVLQAGSVRVANRAVHEQGEVM